VLPLKSSRPNLNRVLGFLVALLVLALLPSCKRGALKQHEYMYVSSPETSLRDRVATMYNKVGTVHNGERVEILEKQKRFLRVRTNAGQEGWVEIRSLVPQEVFDGFDKLKQDNVKTTVQAHGTTRAELNMHLTPSREGEHLYQLRDGEKLEILKRTTAEKNANAPPKPVSATSAKPSATAGKPSTGSTVGENAVPATTTSTASTTASTVPARANSKPTTRPASAGAKASKDLTEPAKPVMEDWYLVRDPAGHVGWVLLRMIDLDIPIEVAQYAEGQRIMGYFVLNTVQDGDKQVPQYLVCLNEPKDGLPWDFNQLRVFSWNRSRHRYETAYRERNLQGYFPASTSHQVFEKEGDLPTFTVRKKMDTGQVLEETYKMNGPMVRRVPTPEEEAAEKAQHEALLAARQKQRSSHPKSVTSAKHHKKH
jgi:SH3-like domain-containing protein